LLVPKPLNAPRPPKADDGDIERFVGGATSLPPHEPKAPAPEPELSRTPARKRRKVLLPINTRLPEDVVDRLDEAAMKTGISRQQIIADALEKYLPKLLKA
jgi:hypothetical protein